MQKLSLEELNRVDIETYKKKNKISITLVLDSVRSMNNVGSAFRTADCFSIEKVILCGITAKPPHREIERTALGATESVDWIHMEKTEQAVLELKKQGYKIVAVEQADKSIFLQDYCAVADQKYALIFGNEVHGVSNEVMELVDSCIEIPQFGTKHSFNISVSIGIILWDFVKKLEFDNRLSK